MYVSSGIPPPVVCGGAWNVAGEDIMIKVGKCPEFQG